MANYVICDASNRVVGENFIAVPPAVQQMLKLQQYKFTDAIIDGQPVRLFALAETQTTCMSDVLVEHNGQLVTMKR